MKIILSACLILLSYFCCEFAAAADWPAFRGPDGQGHSDEAVEIPLRWSEQENVRWKTRIQGSGWSSPVVAGNEVWVTSAIEEERSLRVICLDVKTGKVIHDLEVLRPEELVVKHERNSHATPTPIVADEHVFAHFGTYGTVAIDRATAEIVWKNQEHMLQHQWGPGSSPVLADKLLLFNCDGMEQRYVAAIDVTTGKQAWKSERSVAIDKGGHYRKAFSTPLLMSINDRPAFVSTGANQVSAYDAETGEELWTAQFNGYAAVTMPILAEGLLFVTTGYGDRSLLAIHPETTDEHQAGDIAWSTNRAVPIIPSPIAVAGRIYMVNDSGILQCLDARTGDLHWRQRLPGGFGASPTFAGGRLYFHNDQGSTFVLDPAQEEFHLLATNELDGNIQASLAVADNALFLRTESHVYRIDSAE